jgi:hypothetical protein
MIVVLVAFEHTLKEKLEYHLSPLGFEVIYFQDPVELLAKFDTLECDVILFNSGDYPRHWKPLLKIIRNEKSKQDVVFIMFGAKRMSVEEAYKANYLGANTLIMDDITDLKSLFQIVGTLKLYKGISDKRKFTRYMVEMDDRIGLMFTHPKSMYIVSGSVIDISIEGLKFKPSKPVLTKDLQNGAQIRASSLRAGERIICANLSVVAAGDTISMKLEFPVNDEYHFFFTYLTRTTTRKINLLGKS